MVNKNMFYFMPKTLHNLVSSASDLWDLELKKSELLILSKDILAVNRLVTSSSEERLIYKPMTSMEKKFIELDYKQNRIRTDYSADLVTLFYDDVVPVINSFLYGELAHNFDELSVNEKLRHLNRSYSFNSDFDRGDVIDLSDISHDTDIEVYLRDSNNELFNSFYFSGEHYPYFAIQGIFRKYGKNCGGLDDFIKNFPVIQVQLNKNNDGWDYLARRFFEKVNDGSLIINYVSEKELVSFYETHLKSPMKFLI